MSHKPLAIAALLGAALLAPQVTAAESNYSISEDIYIYLHAGPGTQFRILGSVKAGIPVSITGERQGEYVQIIDDRERTGWVKQDQLTQAESFRLAVPRLNEEVASLKQQLEQQQARNGQLQSQVDQLNSQLEASQRAAMNTEADLKTTLDTLSAENERLEKENRSMKNSERWQWLQQGGMVAGAGLVLGLIIAYLPRPQRRRRNQSGWV
ncbi:TIGR04211 family SH3 domain-containing protein [Ferrimonas sediminicola]|uniref:TIGR04211 family SH3 domain-containing protein n=1 Tax=Ferrimonas sediminicola TaxID=2569538 RepID=A0A4U1BJR6_9GAMM|nr:TIGR04211 family SH3 domain-containing protein [Ferrimonas sediminicola]TKB51442.1 TIGR04211 family SH3 domain-containing protein [Ferrimonas sediminicola]